MQDNILEVKNLTKRFGNFTAVDFVLKGTSPQSAADALSQGVTQLLQNTPQFIINAVFGRLCGTFYEVLYPAD